MNRILTVALAVALTQCFDSVRCNEAEVGDGATKMKYGPADVEIHLRDGSAVRGEITSPETLTLKTAYGVLDIPVTRIVSLRAGLRVATTEDSEISAAIKDLDSDDFNVRGQAQKRLEALGSRATVVLRQNRDKASPEARTRIDALLKKSSGPLDTKPAADDAVKTDEFEALGKLEIETLTVKNRIGDLKVKLADIDAVRWLARGAAKNLTLDGQAALEDWVDTGIETNPGDKMAVSCSGTINLFGQYNSTPEGCTNFSTRSFQVGAVVGRLGLSGKPFLIANSKTWVPQFRGRLFLRIYCMDNLLNNNSNPTTGSYAVHLSSGYFAGDAAAEETGK